MWGYFRGKINGIWSHNIEQDKNQAKELKVFNTQENSSFNNRGM